MQVVLADDSLLLREGLARLLREAQFDVVGQAADVAELRRLMQDVEPDVAIVDIRMPPTFTDEGIRAAHEIRAGHPSTGVLVLSQYLDSSYVTRLMANGSEGLGYLLKDRVSDLGNLLEAVRRIGAGGCVVDAEVVGRLLNRRRQRNPLDELTDRERTVLSLMAEGRSNQGIADAMFLSMKTVEAHIRAVFAKLGLSRVPTDHRRVLAVLTYLRTGPVPDDPIFS